MKELNPELIAWSEIWGSPHLTKGCSDEVLNSWLEIAKKDPLPEVRFVIEELERM